MKPALEYYQKLIEKPSFDNLNRLKVFLNIIIVFN